MPLSKAQLLNVPGGPGVIGGVSAGLNCVIEDGVISATSLEAPVTNILGGTNVSVTSSDGVFTVGLTNPPREGFSSGTSTLFVMAAAPTGWVRKDLSNFAIRIVSSVGGQTVAGPDFTTPFQTYTPGGTVDLSASGISGSVSNVSLTPTGVGFTNMSVGGASIGDGQNPVHDHVQNSGIDNDTPSGSCTKGPGECCYNIGKDNDSSRTGGSGTHSHGLSGNATFQGTASSHAHSISVNGGSLSRTISASPINLGIRYIDTLICTKS